MNIINQRDTSIRAIISILELSIMFICIVITIMMSGAQITIHEFARNLHLIIACLISPLMVNQKFDNVRLTLFMTASRAE